MVKYKKGIWYEACDANIYRTNIENNNDMPVTCEYKHVVSVTRRTGEDVIQVMEEYNIITDDQLSTVKEVTQVVDSDYNLTEEEQKVYELILKKQEIMAIAAKNKEVQKEK